MMSRLIIFLLLLLCLGALSVPNLLADASTSATANVLKLRQNMTVPGHNHMIFDEMDIFVGNMWIFKEFGCSLQPESLSNICYFDNPPVRLDITEGQVGIPLSLTMKITDVNTCKPVMNTYVDIWHANATGWYSNVLYPPVLESTKQSWMTDNPMPKTALRGRYTVGGNGFVTFTTIFPGKLFPPLLQEAPHINFIVHRQEITTNSSGFPKPPEALPHALDHFEVLHSGKIFFDDALVALVNTYEPYSGYWTQPAINSLHLNITPNLTHIVNANDTNYRAEYANGTDVQGKNLDPVAWYRFQGGIWAYVGIGVNTSNTHDFITNNDKVMPVNE